MFSGNEDCMLRISSKCVCARDDDLREEFLYVFPRQQSDALSFKARSNGEFKTISAAKFTLFARSREPVKMAFRLLKMR